MAGFAKFMRVAVAAILIASVSCFGLSGCYSHASNKASKPSAQSTTQVTEAHPVKKKYSDIPTPYPNLYRFSDELPMFNTYNESRVIGWADAANYAGQQVTVEGDVDSIVYSGSSNGSPYFFNMGGGAYEGFAAIVWSEDLPRFSDVTLRNDVAWSASDQPLSIRLRVSGVVEMYNGRPQIVARDGSQMSEWVNDHWCNLLSDDGIEYVMDAIYQ